VVCVWWAVRQALKKKLLNNFFILNFLPFFVNILITFLLKRDSRTIIESSLRFFSTGIKGRKKCALPNKIKKNNVKYK